MDKYHTIRGICQGTGLLSGYHSAVSLPASRYFLMKKLDAILANNRRLIDAEIAENSLLIAFDNPMIIDSLMPLLEKFSKANPNCQLHSCLEIQRIYMIS